MKLLNILSITVMGTLFAVGCSSTSVVNTSDGGATDGGTDSGRVDTGTAPTDSGTASETGADTGTRTCGQCQQAECLPELMVCNAEPAKTGCEALFTCMNACTTAACQEKCITDSMSTEGKDLLECILKKCEAECTKTEM